MAAGWEHRQFEVVSKSFHDFSLLLIYLFFQILTFRTFIIGI